MRPDYSFFFVKVITLSIYDLSARLTGLRS